MHLSAHSKRTIVLGATPNPQRFAFLAVQRLKSYGHEVFPVGIRRGQVAGIDILNDFPVIDQVDTVTLYLNPDHQRPYYDYILGLNPTRIIFNPGTENPELMRMAQDRGIEVEVACTLVMLSLGVY
ncbi:MAG: CoA-binding protein [Saprospiraceae bacterium]|jgi:predicted CoA-binding protein|nr:CoA-binding protein [Saprospiraceae bacterium]